MKQNKYDDDAFFNKYAQMDRSVKGLDGAGEWHVLKNMLPDFYGKRVLDLGCGYGWHCMYALENGASSVTGMDISEKMLAQARAKDRTGKINYICAPLEKMDFPESSFDVVISSLAFHYVASFGDVCEKVSRCLVAGGDFIFSAEHPVFTAYGRQDWCYDEQGNKLHWPVDGYFSEGARKAAFLGEEVVKYHKTLTTYLNSLIKYGFEIIGVVEPQPSKEMLENVEGMKDELRRPMMLLVSAKKK